MSTSLEPGDRLTRDEFERRYEAMTHLKKAELIEGVVYMPSPVRLSRHAEPHLDLMTWMGVYKAFTPGVRRGDNATARLDLDNEPQPDGMLLIDPACGGQATISADDYVENAPELVAEVTSSSVSYDLHTKFTVNRRSGVCEYLVWRMLDKEFDWFVVRAGTFQASRPDESGIFRSQVFPGLWLDANALLNGDMKRVLAVLQEGLACPEHAAFLQK